jgi:medium-chain acyl-CoA synthetase
MEIYDGYGQTETILICGNFKGSKIKPGSMGKPSPGVPLHVVDSEGKECEVGVEGDIAILRSEKDFFGIFEGYLTSDGSLDRRTKVFGGRPWYLTGDRATRDEDGYFWFVGRADDVINSSGYRIGSYPPFLESSKTLIDLPRALRSGISTQAPPRRNRKRSRGVARHNKKRNRQSIRCSHFRVLPEDKIGSRNRGSGERDPGVLQKECESV